jgi:two-component system chemotaxis response regulator CheB
VEQRVPARNVVAIASSVGGIEALMVIIEFLPSNLNAAVVSAQHICRSKPSHLAPILARRTPMQVKQAADGDCLCHACIFVAPPNQHLLVQAGGRLQLSTSPPIHFSRRSAEPLFCSVAALYGRNCLGVVLIGGDSDGSLGVQVIKNAGGKIIVQDKATSVDFSMPESAIKTGAVDLMLPLNEIPAAIVSHVNELTNNPPPTHGASQ